MRKVLLLALCVLLSPSCSRGYANNDDPHTEKSVDWEAAADSSSLSLLDHFWNASEKYFYTTSSGNTTFQYWPQAHALDVLVDAFNRTGYDIYKSGILLWYDGVEAKNDNTFLNIYYDDMEWNALAMLRAYNATGEIKFKEAVDEVWEDIKTGWNTNAGGGISWRKDMPYSKNACSNGPAAILAARMYTLENNEEDLEWA